MRGGWDDRGLRRVVELSAVVVALAVAVVSLRAAVTPAAGSPPPSTSSTVAPLPGDGDAPVTTRPNPASVPIGVYGGPGGLSAVQTLAGSTGATVTYALDYFDDSTWQSLADPAWIVSQWRDSGYRMIWGVPMLPASGASLAVGATGRYDPMFAQLARLLVADGQGSSTLMVGFDPDQQSNPWFVSTPDQASAYVAYWQQIVTAMRAVPGAAFQFTWNVSGGGALAPDSLYPGDAYVDTVATGVVDQSGTLLPVGGRWTAIADATGGAQWFASFAAQHHKEFSVISFILLPSSSPGGGGDDPTFVQQFLQWAAAVPGAIAVIWDYGPQGIASGAFPASLATLGQVLGQGGTPTPPG